MNFLVYLMSLILVFMIFLLILMHNVLVSFYILEWSFMGLKFNFYFNTLVFSLILLIITASVIVFSTYYLNNELWFGYYFVVLLVFVGSMFMLNFSNAAFTMMLSWDLLGISSFFLVLFYSNWDSNLGAMNTAITNRLGDFFMFCFFVSSLFGNYYFWGGMYMLSMPVFFLLYSSFTKSAQYPFSSWLPKAMSAPTPVSSLVHSSTLVTAGLILLLNFGSLIMMSGVLKILLVTGLFTMMFSSVAALVEEDMKKVVALSTLSQLGFMVFTLGLGLHFVSFLHLLSHALFKSCLFMQIGYVIHGNFSQQDGRFYSSNGSFSMFVQLQLLLTLFCLCGLIFTSGMMSKDLILEMFFFNNEYVYLMFIFMVSVFLTFGYSYRLWKSFFYNFNKVVIEYSTSFVINFLSFLLVFLSILFIYWLMNNFCVLPSLFLYMDLFLPLFYILLLMFTMWLLIKVMFKELVYKFQVDYYSKWLAFGSFNMKFLDAGSTKFGERGYFTLNILSKMFLMFMSSLSYNSIIIIIFFIFLLM